MAVKRTIVRAMILEQLGLQNSAIPPNFPSEAQVQRKVTTVKYWEKKNASDVLDVYMTNKGLSRQTAAPRNN